MGFLKKEGNSRGCVSLRGDLNLEVDLKFYGGAWAPKDTMNTTNRLFLVSKHFCTFVEDFQTILKLLAL